MGTYYTYILHDEWDWYDTTREHKIAQIKEAFPVAEILSHWPHYIVVALDKISPHGDSIQPLQKYCENAWCYPDTATYELKEVKFKKLTEDKAIEDNKPENRNKQFIEQANKEWTAKYNAKLRSNASQRDRCAASSQTKRDRNEYTSD